MQNLDKYFWDQTLNSSIQFKTRRLFEYASFPDLLKIPFEQVRKDIGYIDLERLRTGEKRIAFLKKLRDCASFSDTWDEALMVVCGLTEKTKEKWKV